MQKTTTDVFNSSYYLAVKSQKKDKEWLETAWKLKDPIKRLRHMGK